MIFSRGDQPLSEGAARNCFIANQFATPGLGSLIGGKWVSGMGQLILAIIGFILVMVWFFLTLKEAYTLMDSTGTPPSYAWVGISGAVIFAGSWFWALATSVQLLREARRNKPPVPDVPPQFPGAPPAH